MMKLNNHQMMIEVSPLMMLEMRMHQKLYNKEKINQEKEKDQTKQKIKKLPQSDKKNSLRSSVSKKTSHNLKTISEMMKNQVKKMKQRHQPMNDNTNSLYY